MGNFTLNRECIMGDVTINKEFNVLWLMLH